MKALAAKLFLFILTLIIAGLPVVGEIVNTQQSDSTIKRSLTVQDIMRFKSIIDPTISDNGNWVIYRTQPDLGNGEVVVYNCQTSRSYIIERGKDPAITGNGKWVAALVLPDALAIARQKTVDNQKVKTGMLLMKTNDGKAVSFENVQSFVFSKNSKWLVYRLFRDDYRPDEDEDGDNGNNKWEKRVFSLVLRHLSSGKETRIDRVLYFSIDPSAHFLAYSIHGVNGKGNGLFVRNLAKKSAPEIQIAQEDQSLFTNLAWSKSKSRLGYLYHKHKQGSSNGRRTYESGLWVWDGLKNKTHAAVAKNKIRPGWMIPAENKLQWTRDGERLFFGFKPYDEYMKTMLHHVDPSQKWTSLFNTEQILENRDVDVWHWKDPRINPHQKKMWPTLKKKLYYAVYHFKENHYIPLADKIVPDLRIPENPDVALGFSDLPYLREVSWDGVYNDVYVSFLKTGFRRKILTRHQYSISMSPSGRYVVYYKDKFWYIYDVRLKYSRRLTAAIKNPFYNEDYDYPAAVPGYGIAGWTENDQSVILYDKYDIWEFYMGSDANRYHCLTQGIGRKNKMVFRIQRTDPEETFFKQGETCLVNAYSDTEKYTAFYRLTIGKPGIEKLLQEEKYFRFLKKARKADRVLYTRESYSEFPDIWLSDVSFRTAQRITDVNPQMKEYSWGKAELLEWKALDGTPLQGVVIKPENYDATKSYPVLVCFYRFFSNTLYRFNRMTLSHLPNFPYLSSNGYVLFLPDVRYQIGHPGQSAFNCIVPGVEKLVELGIANPNAIGIHGHSWSGYQAAYLVTRTSMFKAAIMGAPVVNMTSAYNAIRWRSGMARQFQYEKGQTRLGKNLWEKPELYIENSPVFFAPQVETPVLIQCGDKDGVVPWAQGIEFYLSLRRLNKKCILLQYNNETHILKRYPNRLDFTLKIKEYLDHHLKGKPAPKWITEGVPYTRK